MVRIKGKAGEELRDFYLSFNQSPVPLAKNFRKMKIMEIAKSRFKKSSWNAQV